MMSCLFATISFSQKLFKVDRTKSAKTAVAKSSASNSTAKPKTSSVPKKGKTFAKRKYRSKKYRKAEEAEEPYILINGKYVEEAQIGYSGGEKMYNFSMNVVAHYNFYYIDEDGNFVEYEPSWCRFGDVYGGDVFSLKFDPNPTFQPRTTLFALESNFEDDTFAVLRITQSARPSWEEGGSNPFTIKDCSVSNIDKNRNIISNFGETIHSCDTKYLLPRLTIFSVVPGSHVIYFKLFKTLTCFYKFII